MLIAEISGFLADGSGGLHAVDGASGVNTVASLSSITGTFSWTANVTVGEVGVIRASGTVASTDLRSIAGINSNTAGSTAGLESISRAQNAITSAVVRNITVASRITAKNSLLKELVLGTLDTGSITNFRLITGTSSSTTGDFTSSVVVLGRAFNIDTITKVNSVARSSLVATSMCLGLHQIRGAEAVDSSAVLSLIARTSSSTADASAVVESLLALTFSSTNGTLAAIQGKVLLTVGVNGAERRPARAVLLSEFILLPEGV